MTTSKRLAERKIAKFEKSIRRKGGKKVFEPEHLVLVVFAVLAVGSFVFQVVKMALNDGEA